MKWRQPPIIKIYEALGTVADRRIEVHGNTAKVFSSSGNKHYDVSYDFETKAIMANDNASYWQGTLGYPAIAFLLQTGVLPYREDIANLLKGIKWKDINQKFKNNFEKTLEHIQESLPDDSRKALQQYAEDLDVQIKQMDLSVLGKKQKPPAGY